MSELKPYKSEYAKSGRSTCKRCTGKIEQGTLRIAVQVQSGKHDGVYTKWHHEDCFIKTYQPISVTQIDHFNKLRPDDKKRIEELIGRLGAGPAAIDAKAKRRASPIASDPVINLQNFHIEYSKTNRATCRTCDIKIVKDEIRVSKTVYDTEVGMKYGGQPLWHHFACFVKERSNLQYFATAEELPGFASLSKSDKEIVKNELKPLVDSDIPIKKIKDEPKDEAQIKQEKDLLKKIEKQDKLFHKYKDALSKFNKAICHKLLEENSQNQFSNIDTCREHLADCMAFGALEPCPECKNGQLVLEDYNYKCTGDLTEWTKCSYTTVTPTRKTMKIPKNYSEMLPFNGDEPKVDVRVFLSPPPAPVVLKKEPESGPSKSMPIPPLKNLQFFITSKLKTPKEEIKKRILKMGGLVVKHITATTAAAISTKEQLEKIQNLNSVMYSIKEMDVEVVEEDFLDKIDPVNGTIKKTLELITELNIAPWGSGPTNRVPKDVINGKFIQKSGSQYANVNESKSKNLIIKERAAVDPDSGLQDTSHVYEDDNRVIYNAVLCKSDKVAKKNSYYKLQVLEDDSAKKYYLFSSWGRISSSKTGNKKTKPCRSICNAVDEFERLFFDKTGNHWNSNVFIKIPDHYNLINVNYDDSDIGRTNLVEDTNCKLPLPVKELIVKIFDMDIMKKTLVEYKLNTETMPLGKLSKRQIKLGYEVLTELLEHVKNQKSISNKILDATNRFFTMIPHNFGLQSPPILDNLDAITKKTQMLDNLLEIEIAYSLLKTEGEDTEVNPIEANYLKLKAKIAPLPTDCPEFDIIKKYVTNTHVVKYYDFKLQIEQVFKVDREGENKRFEPFQTLHNRRLLWHGSRVTNFAGILSQGLRIAPPEAPQVGYNFGKGIYFADIVSKSAQYCYTDSVGVLLLCEVALGDMKKCNTFEYVTTLPEGTHSVWGTGKIQPDPAGSEELDGILVPCGKPTRCEQSSLDYNDSSEDKIFVAIEVF